MKKIFFNKRDVTKHLEIYVSDEIDIEHKPYINKILDNALYLMYNRDRLSVKYSFITHPSSFLICLHPAEASFTSIQRYIDIAEKKHAS